MIPSPVMWHLMQAVRRILVTTWPSAIVALAAWISIVACIDPAGSYPSMPEGPGLTIDEMFNVQQGVYLVESARALGWYNFVPGTSIETFKPKNRYNPDHPPLGRYWLGVHHQLTWWIAPPFEPDGPFVTACARTGSATAFALTVWLIGAFASCSLGPVDTSRLKTDEATPEEPADLRPPLRGESRCVGLFASLALVLMPRVYGHAHLAALESITNLTCTAAVLAIAGWWKYSSPPSRRAAILAGIVMGLAMLTKIQAILIPVPVLLWSLWRWRFKAVVPLLLWGLTALTLFFACWPYLWLDPVGHFLEYLGRTTNRATIHCYYFGVRYDDKAVPWHYPFFMFVVTVPIVLHILGVLGLKFRGAYPAVDQQFDKVAPGDEVWINRLLLGCCLFPLIVFALPGVAVYDGERLFLTVFPIWAIFVGRGAACLFASATSHYGSSFSKFAMSLLIVIQLTSNLLNHPTYLSYYNLAVGGLWGANALGLEMNYWGDSVTRGLLRSGLDENSSSQLTSVQITPSLHQFQNQELVVQSPILRDRMQHSSTSKMNLLITFRRRADVDDQIFQEFQAFPEAGRRGSLFNLAIIDARHH